MTRRPGITMTELLVAIFVVAIGLAGVMSMVPFGAKQMSDALVADRATSHAQTIDGLMRAVWKEKVVEDTTGNGSGEPFWAALDNPGNGLPQPGANEASYPVFVDPIGCGRGGSSQNWVGDNGSTDTSIPRRTLNAFPNPDNAIGPWSQADGFSWDEDSRPVSGAAMREYRYNALAIVQRPNNSQRTTATLKVVVFSNRRPRFFPTGSEAAISNVTLTPTATALSIPTSSIPSTSEIRKGGWIMDATVLGTIRHANFYRVVSAIENTAGTLDIELHTPIKRIDGNTTSYPAKLVLIPGIAGVFERTALAPSTGP